MRKEFRAIPALGKDVDRGIKNQAAEPRGNLEGAIMNRGHAAHERMGVVPQSNILDIDVDFILIIRRYIRGGVIEVGVFQFCLDHE